MASGERPGLIFDYGGFPPHTYRLTYPAPGSPAVARRVAELGASAGIEVALDAGYGWDHGVFVPVAVSWPEADVPIVAVSLRTGLDPTEHVAFGRALAPLRDENVMILGSGLSVHDLSFRVSASEATAFDRWLEKALALDPADRPAALARWSEAPGGRACHPREEHLLPLMVVVGAGGEAEAVRTYRDTMLGWPVAAYAFAA
ncbi:MAG: DODA-type extradiol aromatic ring-opening family dioxygenase [Acidimicrobiales bacterium]